MSLRVVIWCNFHTSPDLGRCSAVNIMFDLCNWLHKNRPGFHAYFFGPSERVEADSGEFIGDRSPFTVEVA